MTAEIRVPTERTCLDCGRHERWDDAQTTWRIDDEAGEVHCIHVWDITGEFTPVVE